MVGADFLSCAEKKSILGNQDITYAARRLQSLHNFAEKNFGLTKVTIEQAESKLKVRAYLHPAHPIVTGKQIGRAHV